MFHIRWVNIINTILKSVMFTLMNWDFFFFFSTLKVLFFISHRSEFTLLRFPLAEFSWMPNFTIRY